MQQKDAQYVIDGKNV